MEKTHSIMDTIIYQGQEIEAEVIGQVDRRIDCGSHYNASDSLLRDEAGFYYVQREILEAVGAPDHRGRYRPAFTAWASTRPSCGPSRNWATATRGACAATRAT